MNSAEVDAMMKRIIDTPRVLTSEDGRRFRAIKWVQHYEDNKPVGATVELKLEDA